MADHSQNHLKRIKTDSSITDSPQSVSHSQGFLSQSPFQNPYSGYSYGYPHQSYLPQQGPLQPLSQPLQLGQPQPLSPVDTRKRRASELENASMSAGSSMSAYSLPPHNMMNPQHGGNPHGLGISTHQPMRVDSHMQPQPPPPQPQDQPSPAPKKGRTNTPWTPAEEQRLKQMRDAGNSWSEIAKTFPTRTEGSVKKHWYKDMHYAEFAEDEGSFSNALLAAIKEYETNKWKVIGQKVGKPAKYASETQAQSQAQAQAQAQGYHDAQLAPGFYMPIQQQQNPITLQHHGVPHMLPSQLTAPEPTYLDASMSYSTQANLSRQVSHSSSSQYGSPYPQAQTLPGSRKRSRQESLAMGHGGMQDMHNQQSNQGGIEPVYHFAPSGQQSQQQVGSLGMRLETRHQPPSTSNTTSAQSDQSPIKERRDTHQYQHHHRLPDQSPPMKSPKLEDTRLVTPEREGSHVNLVGTEGMPEPAAKPKGPKLKFTPEDDTLLVELKETTNMTWKQIADFFPGRSSGTLQVRYCTKLKAKTVDWSDDMVRKLRTAMHDYDNDRWRVIAGRVGGGLSAAAVKEKANELDEYDRLQMEDKRDDTYRVEEDEEEDEDAEAEDDD
ncbi:hypothetical protein MBLNU457_3075t2 [Dothideomycetes sp. NU457]